MKNLNVEGQTNELIYAFQQGDANAFSELYDMYVQPLFYYGCHLTDDRELLKDCIQDVFVKLYLKKDALNTIEKFKSYLYISLKNRLCDEVRRQTMLSDTDLSDLPGLSTGETVEEKYVTSESQKNNSVLVHSLMNSLSPRQRRAIQLYYIEGKEYDEICSIMQMNYQSVRNLVYRSMLKLRECAQC